MTLSTSNGTNGMSAGPDVNGFTESRTLRNSSLYGTGSSERPPMDPDEPIAVIGLSLKFPGSATSESNFWDLLCKKKSTVTPVPEDRFKIDSFYRSENIRHDEVSICFEIHQKSKRLN